MGGRRGQSAAAQPREGKSARVNTPTREKSMAHTLSCKKSMGTPNDSHRTRQSPTPPASCQKHANVPVDHGHEVLQARLVALAHRT